MESNKMEGYLYLINPHRIRIRGFRKRYFVLEGSEAFCYKAKPADDSEKLSLRHGMIHPFTKVEDVGIEFVHGQPLHSFTLFDPDNVQYKLTLAAKTAEEAAKWMTAFKEAADQSRVSSNGSIEHRPSLGAANKVISFKDWTQQWTAKQTSPDVISDSPWKILGCRNGLRLFRESSKAKGRFRTKFSDDHPAVMAVGVIKASCEYIFNAVTTLELLRRAEWDFCFLGGEVVERIDGHTDIVHEKLHRKWLPGHMRQRDLLIHRYWRRENDGTYVILYRSVKHKNCPSGRRVVRANLKSGGYVISPVTPEGTYPARSLVRHMLEIDWKTWKSHFKPSRVQKITIRMLERIGALRELCKAEASSIQRELDKEENYKEKDIIHREPTFKSAKFDLGHQESFLQQELDEADEFYDAPDEDDDGWQEENLSASETEGEEHTDTAHNKQAKLAATLTSVSFVKRLAQKKEANKEAGALESEGTLPRCSTFSSTCCWDVADPGTFLIRGKNYLRDQNKVKAKDTLMQLVAVDWYRSTERMDHVAEKENTFMQKPKVRRLNRCFFFIVNLQVPGSTTYSLVLYYMLKDMLSSVPLLEKFVNGTDRFRSSRFKLIPHVAEGSWIVKQSVGKTACLVGEALDINYFHGKHHLELDVDVGSSSVAKGVVSLVFGYMKKLVVEMAFLVQANTEDELPEMLLGTCRISSLDVAKAVQLTA